jgi:hypothetical protein
MSCLCWIPNSPSLSFDRSFVRCPFWRGARLSDASHAQSTDHNREYNGPYHPQRKKTRRGKMSRPRKKIDPSIHSVSTDPFPTSNQQTIYAVAPWPSPLGPTTSYRPIFFFAGCWKEKISGIDRCCCGQKEFIVPHFALLFFENENGRCQ